MFTRDVNPALDPLNTNSHYDSIVTCTKSQPDYNYNYLDETQISDELKCYNAKHPGKNPFIRNGLICICCYEESSTTTI